MRILVIIFAVSLAVLGVLALFPGPANPVADGRLVCAPLPPALARAEEAPLAAPTGTALQHIEPPAAPVPVEAARLQFVEPPATSDQLAAMRQADRVDWGMVDVPAAKPVVIAAAPRPRPVEPVEPPVAPPPGPNLYLPAGATTEEEAALTLIKPELEIYAEPFVGAAVGPVKLKAGDQVRPLTRLRNEAEFDWIKFEKDGGSWWAQAEYFIRVDPRNRRWTGGNLPVGEEAVDRNSALTPDYKPDDLVALPSSVVLREKEILVRREVAEAAADMVKAAEKENLTLRIFSGFRDFEYQKKLYLEAIEKDGPKQDGVAEPGYSEHQLGTTIDISNRDLKFILNQSFALTAEGQWLKANAERFGFRFSYTNENTQESGYKPEPWHLRYMGRDLLTESDRAIARP